jgi:hypothetical protein
LNIAQQKARVITIVLAKAVRFIENNSDIIETLVDDLMQEQMHDAVEAVCRHHLDIGT